MASRIYLRGKCGGLIPVESARARASWHWPFEHSIRRAEHDDYAAAASLWKEVRWLANGNTT
jgi:hypothetical protein